MVKIVETKHWLVFVLSCVQDYFYKFGCQFYENNDKETLCSYYWVGEKISYPEKSDPIS